MKKKRVRAGRRVFLKRDSRERGWQAPRSIELSHKKDRDYCCKEKKKGIPFRQTEREKRKRTCGGVAWHKKNLIPGGKKGVRRPGERERMKMLLIHALPREEMGGENPDFRRGGEQVWLELLRRRGKRDKKRNKGRRVFFCSGAADTRGEKENFAAVSEH